MSFSYEVKTELCKLKPESLCCKKAMLYGLMLFGRNFTVQEITLQTEHPFEIETVSKLTEELLGIEPEIKVSDREKPAIFSLRDKTQIKKVFDYFGYNEKIITLRINRANLENECCTAAFLRGVFLACGTIVEPQKDYHIEFVSPHYYLSRDLSALLKELDFSPKLLRRKGNCVIYFKESAQIEDILTLMGAADKSLELMNIKIYKDFRNKANRVTNCETANIEKTVAAASQQISAIKKIMAADGFSLLPSDLRNVAELRLSNPEMTLSEMSAALAMSKSGVNHRLRRIIQIAEKSISIG